MSSCLNVSVGSKTSIFIVAKEVGVVTDSLEKGVSRGDFATSFDWEELLAFRTSEILATFTETNKGAKIQVVNENAQKQRIR